MPCACVYFCSIICSGGDDIDDDDDGSGGGKISSAVSIDICWISKWNALLHILPSLAPKILCASLNTHSQCTNINSFIRCCTVLHYLMCRFARSNDAWNGGQTKTYILPSLLQKENRGRERERGVGSAEPVEERWCVGNPKAELFNVRILSGFL